MSRRLPFVHSYKDRHGKSRHYFRRRGYARVTLPGTTSSPEFVAAYACALTGQTAPPIEIAASRARPGSVAQAVGLYLGSADYLDLVTRSKRALRLLLDRFRAEHGDRPIADLRRKHVEAMMTGMAPHAARAFFRALRAVAKVAVRAGLIEVDPTAGARRPRIKDSGGFRCWTDDQIVQFEQHYPIESRARLAFALLLCTGQRRGDVILMGRQHVRGGFIHVRQAKTGANLQIKVMPELEAILAAHPAVNMTFLTTNTGQPFSPTGFSNWFNRVCSAAGLPGLSAHGLRKAMCRKLAEAGCSANQIASVSGHKTLREVQRYTQAADQKAMAEAAMKAMEEQKRSVLVANLPVKEVATRPAPRGKKPCA
jgi:integrase